MEKVQLEKLKRSAVVSLQISGEFYMSLQQVLVYLTDQKTKEEIDQFVDKINRQVPTEELEEWEQVTQTMMVLCVEIEETAKEQNLTETVEIPLTQ